MNKTEKNVLRACSPTGFHDGGVTTLLSESCFSVRPTLAFQGQVLHTSATCVIKPPAEQEGHTLHASDWEPDICKRNINGSVGSICPQISLKKNGSITD